MPDPNQTTTNSPLDAILGDYLQAVEAGAVPSRQALYDAHPDLAADLREFFANFDRLDRQADAIRLAATAERPAVRYFGEYELIEEVARGAMGVVYKARQASLDRIVALKMIGAGELATAEQKFRFRTEAEAAAALDHPNIVPIYEIGEHDGQPYFTMKFAEGGTLAQEPRGKPATEAARLEAVARAFHFAHQRGILHRDLKPSNVLRDRDGVLLVADFGLAKRVDVERSLTASGAPVGTPKYMAPEQAAGRRGLTTAADVYALGVMLYERLTGRVPFVAEHWSELFRLVQHAEPPRPASLVPGLPADLETVCLKCLRKEPGQRYATAGEFADDLGRWQRGEPIAARPVGRLERAWLWCRRNPAVAGLTAGVAASLVAGTVVSSYFAVTASRQAERAERNLVRSFLRPLGYASDPLNDAERQSLSELSQLADDRLRLLCLEEALATPETATRFTRRADEIVQAAVGANERRRQRALAVASRVQRNEAMSPQSRLAACGLALHLGGTDLRGPDRLAEWLSEGIVFAIPAGDMTAEQAEALWPVWMRLLEATDNADALQWAGRGVALAAGRLDAVAERERLGRAADLLIGALGKVAGADAVMATGTALEAVAGRLEPAAAAQRFDALIGVLRTVKALEPMLQPVANVSLAALARRLDPAAAAARADALIDLLKHGGAEGGYARRAAGIGLAALAGQLDPAAVASRADALVDALRTADKFALHMAAIGLAAFADRLDPAGACLRCGQAADLLTGVLGRSDDRDTLHGAGQGLVAVARHLGPAATAKGVDALIGVLGAAEVPERTNQAARGLAALSVRLDRAGEQARLRKVAEALIGGLGKRGGDAAGDGLAELASRLEPVAVVECADVLIGVLAAPKAEDSLGPAATALAGFAAQLDPAAERARLLRIADAMIAVQKKRSLWTEDAALSSSLAALAPRLDPAAVASRADAVIGALKIPADAGDYPYEISVLAALAPRLDPPAAGRCADALIGVLGATTNDAALSSIGASLATLSGRLDRPDVERYGRRATEVITARLVRDDKVMSGLLTAFARMVAGLPAELADSSSRSVLQRAKVWHDEWRGGESTPRIVEFGLHRIESVTACLRDHRCTVTVRAAALRRLEQLTYAPTGPDQERVVAGALAGGLAEPSAVGLLALGRRVAFERQWRFRTVWDAVAWLRQHHPEIDLDAPSPLTRRNP